MKPSAYKMMNEGFTHYLAGQQKTAPSIRSSIKQVKLFLTWLEQEQIGVQEVTYQDLLLYMQHCQKRDLTQKTIQQYMTHIRHYYAYLEVEKQVAYNPVAGIEVKGIKRKALYYILEPSELHQLYNGYPGASLKDRRNKVILGLLVYQGLKAGELRKLEVKDVKLREGKIEIPGGRRSNGRVMTLEPCQVMDLYDYVLQVRPQLMAIKPKKHYQVKEATGKLFIGEGGTYRAFNNFMIYTITQARKLNSHLVNVKQVRASVITKWLKIYNLREVQYRAGHRYISTTESYLQNDVEGLQEETNQYHPLG